MEISSVSVLDTKMKALVMLVTLRLGGRTYPHLYPGS